MCPSPGVWGTTAVTKGGGLRSRSPQLHGLHNCGFNKMNCQSFPLHGCRLANPNCIIIYISNEMVNHRHAHKLFTLVTYRLRYFLKGTFGISFPTCLGNDPSHIVEISARACVCGVESMLWGKLCLGVTILRVGDYAIEMERMSRNQ